MKGTLIGSWRNTPTQREGFLYSSSKCIYILPKIEAQSFPPSWCRIWYDCLDFGCTVALIVVALRILGFFLRSMLRSGRHLHFKNDFAAPKRECSLKHLWFFSKFLNALSNDWRQKGVESSKLDLKIACTIWSWRHFLKYLPPFYKRCTSGIDADLLVVPCSGVFECIRLPSASRESERRRLFISNPVKYFSGYSRCKNSCQIQQEAVEL